MRLLVCGGRDYDDRKSFDLAMSLYDTKLGISVIIHGGAPGADRMADVWAQKHDIPCFRFPAQWRKYGKPAGAIRNRQMIEIGLPDAVLAFPGGDGTADMVNKAKRSGITVYEVKKVPV